MSDTTDDLTPGDESLASAYLDSEATPEERARVEASPELLAEVEQLRQVRAVLGATTDPPPISVRESHLAAALDVWDRMSGPERAGEVTPSAGIDAAAGAAISTPTPTSLTARRARRSSGNSSRWLLGAAAGLVLIAGAGLALRSIGSETDDDIASSADSADEPAEEPASEVEEVPELAASEFAGDEAESAPAEVAADDVEEADGRTEFADEPADEPAEAMEEEAPAEEAAEEPATDEGSNPADDPSVPEIDLERLETPEELGDFAAFAAYADFDAEAPVDDIPPPFNTCEDVFGPFFDIEQYTEPAIYRGEQVVIGIDFDADPVNVIAYREIDCVIVEQVPLPTRDEFEARTQP